MVFQLKHRVLWLTIAWPILWLTVSFILTNGMEQTDRFIQRSIPIVIGMALIVFVNLKYLLPSLYFKKKRIQYIIACLLLIVSVLLILNTELFHWSNSFEHPRDLNFKMQQDSRRPGRSFFGMRSMMMSFPYIIALLGSTLTEVSRFAGLKEKEAIEYEKEKLETELKFLRSQINPHFLFNVLNNIYTLTLLQSDKAPESLLRLSNMLRYMLYDSNEGKVSLQKEITYIKNFIGLHQLKNSQTVAIQLDLDEDHPNLLIPPLLFIPFIENAFKHSNVMDSQSGYITIKLDVNKESIDFQVENSYPTSQYNKDKVGGIGLSNIHKRLELLYPNQHRLDIYSGEQTFRIHLNINRT